MSQAQGYRGQGSFPLYNFSGTITAGGTAQLLLPYNKNGRSYFYFQNTSDKLMTLGVGCGQATATVTANAVASIAVNNGGFNFTYPPIVHILGGAAQTEGVSDCLGGGWQAATPVDVATATAVLSGTSVASITVTHKGSGYTGVPFIWLENDPRDPFGVFLPTATAGIALPASSLTPYIQENAFICTDPIAVLCDTTGKTFNCFAAP